MPNRSKGQPNRDIFNLFLTLNQQQNEERHGLSALFDGRLRSHAQNFEGMKRKWEGFTGVPLPKKLRKSVDPPASSENDGVASNSAAKITAVPTRAVVKKTSTTLPATVPVHADDKLDVDIMIVNNLRKELKKRGLNTAGRKADLQKRLRAYLAESRQKREAEWAARVKKAEVQVQAARMQGQQQQKSRDAVMQDVEEDEEESNVEKAVKRPMATATRSALNSSKYAFSVKRSANLEETITKAKDSSPAPKLANPIKVSEESSDAKASSSTTAATQSSVQKTKLSALAGTPGGAAFKTTPSSGAGSAKLLEKKKHHAAQSEARKARMAEMRQKAKPTVGSATKPPSTYAASAALKKMASSSTLGQSKSNDILAKMREKAAAEKKGDPVAIKLETQKKPPTVAIGGPLRHDSSMVAKQGSMASSASTKKVTKFVPLKPVAAVKPSPTSSHHKSALRLKALQNSQSANKPPAAVKPVEKPLSPKQTYEMSDREEEESDSESDSDSEYERQRPKKTIPEWAQKPNLMRALERQYAEGPHRLDPDKIFGEVLTCNLDDIFDKKKSRYQRRTSSGNWSRDRVTTHEKLAYKRAVGLKV